MSNIEDLVWTKKYRPKTFEELIFNDKETLLAYMKNPKSMPSFIFYSSSPGTGKTSTAFLIAETLGSDLLKINASDDRGIDTVREKVKSFISSMSMNSDVKRCVFLDEADAMTKAAQESLKSMMEEYSENSFFIFSCNDVSKIVEPIKKGRCEQFNFQNPSKQEILKKLENINSIENLGIDIEKLDKIVNIYYPDVREMVSKLQRFSLNTKEDIFDETLFKEMASNIKSKNVQGIYELVYNPDFKVLDFNRWYFDKVFNSWEEIGLEKAKSIALVLADTEKYWNLGCNVEVVFLSNILKLI